MLAPYTTWKVGGAARWFAEPTSEEAPDLIAWAYSKGIPIYYLGRGSNVLISDDGLPGLVISTRNSMTELYRDGDTIVAESGVSYLTCRSLRQVRVFLALSFSLVFLALWEELWY
ncbi:MAG: FAD-binding protein [Phormidesmis sp. RL_2_1]|nr:FAD-binding protein [Phormidesmis sp. RL_2_1]